MRGIYGLAKHLRNNRGTVAAWNQSTIGPLRFFSSEKTEKTESTEDTKEEKKERLGFQKFKQQYRKPDFLQDDYDHLKKERTDRQIIEDTGFDLGDDEFLPDYFVQDAPSYKRNTVAINLPWLINGAPDIDIQTRFLGE